MNRVLGLDIGKKRIGISVSDPLLITAQPLDTIAREPEENALEKIKELCLLYNVNKIVAGLPKNMNGTEGQQALDCKEFSQKVAQKTNVGVILEDERLTSKQAEFTLRQQNKKYTKNKGMVDKISAILILQQYLDKESKNG